MAKKNKVQKPERSGLAFPVVGIGASAGGLEALKQFLKALPARSGMAFVFIQHLSPNHVSILPELLATFSPVPVQAITDMIHIEPNHLYIVPENKVVTTTDGVLHLQARSPGHKKNDVIDLFFSSLGIVHQSYAVGIVLSGTLNDGTVGLQVIKSYGGLTFAQDGGSAAFNSMPNSAVKAGVIDFVLPPAKIAERLVAINEPFQAEPVFSEENTFKQILAVLRARSGVDFRNYKSSTLKRRIIRRMALSKNDSLTAYLEKLRESKTEQDSLYNDMLISVTNFFRDPDAFNTVCSEIFPAIYQNKLKDNEPLRIWIAGCATGEEAYSMAICLQEKLGDSVAALKIQIFATDISETAITKARSGMYRAGEMEGLSPDRIKHFFTKLDGNYQVNKQVRDMCVFAHHNLLKDPPFSKIDLLSCRNVMIYLEPVLQAKALHTFHYALNKNSYLWLGKSETIGRQTDIFSALKGTDKLYIRKGGSGRYMDVASYARESTFREINNELRKEEDDKDIFKIAEDAMLESLVPPCVLINEKFDIIQFKGSTDPWLTFPKGKPSFNLLKVGKEGISFELQTMLLQSKNSDQPTYKYGINYTYLEQQHFVDLQVIPLASGSDRFFLISFHKASGSVDSNLFEIPREAGDNAYDASAMRIEQLERELLQTRANMRVITEEQETANEKLQSYNEELLSAGEEQQSLNEELETSKEELQSTNEEIITINKELLDRNEQLSQSRLYTEAIVDTIRDPLLILDDELRVRRASRSFYAKFRLTENEVEGKLLYELGDNEWDIPGLRKMLERILPDKLVMEDFKVNADFRYIGVRKLILNARKIVIKNEEQLILLALESEKPD